MPEFIGKYVGACVTPLYVHVCLWLYTQDNATERFETLSLEYPTSEALLLARADFVQNVQLNSVEAMMLPNQAMTIAAQNEQNSDVLSTSGSVHSARAQRPQRASLVPMTSMFTDDGEAMKAAGEKQTYHGRLGQVCMHVCAISIYDVSRDTCYVTHMLFFHTRTYYEYQVCIIVNDTCKMYIHVHCMCP